MHEFADRIVIGKIYPVDGSGKFAEAMAIRDGKILAVGTQKEAEEYKGQDTLVEQKDGMILPGFTEGHAHVTCASEMILGVALGHEEEPEGYLRRIEEWLKSNPGAEYVFGSGYDNGVFGPEGPTAKLLDTVCKDVPAVLVASDHHSRWLNSKALQVAGICDTTPNPMNGEIVRDAAGHATGWLKETAMALANPAVPEISPAVYASAVEYYQRIALANGVTNVFEPLFDPLRDYSARAEGYRLLEQEGKLLLTARLGYSLEADDDFSTAFSKMKQIRDDLRACTKVQMTTAKFFVDGVVECHTAFLRENYADAETYGEPMIGSERLNHDVLAAMEAGFDIHTHVIGDAAADMAIDAYVNAQDKLEARGRNDFRNALTHLQLVASDAMDRMAKHGILGVVNPYWHYFSPVYFEELEKPYLGVERASEEYPMRSLLDAGIHLSQASDFPVTVPPRTLDSIHLMVNRAEPRVEDALPLNKAQCIGLNEAIEIATIRGAEQLRLEHCKGSLEKGKDADFVVLSENLFSLPADQICTAEVNETYIGGTLCYSRI